ncbi:MAG: 4-(cytidine 5'-diphospho)-2-C-methyl-D-erythritol kinase [Gemmataceae bacterium]|nr:4-(cytidine 5'-diphospho)-2-C-methyl-D-erythritol kinase [Gemmataceae bacterium]
MRLFQRGSEVVVWAPAKVNLFLEVLGKRPDGYHAISTLMLAIRRFDTLHFQDDPAGLIQITCPRSGLSTGDDNLVVRAAQLLRTRSGVGRGCRIRLLKRIPLAAGLAGGSSDAAATLLALNRLWRLKLSQHELEDLGARLGSDVPFFFHLPAAWCEGRGEIVTPVAAPRALDLVLLCPRFGCSTRAVYDRVEIPRQPVDGTALLAAFRAGDVEGIGRRLHNRLQAAAEAIAPPLAEFHRRLRALAPAGALLSGSGSTLFALCRSRPEARELARRLRADSFGQYCVDVVRTCSEQLPL